MNTKVRSLIAFDIQTADADRTRHRRLEDRRQDIAICGRHSCRFADIDGNDGHYAVRVALKNLLAYVTGIDADP